jgi:hypothetical protein
MEIFCDSILIRFRNLINYGSGSVTAKSYGSYGSGSATLLYILSTDSQC